MPTSTFQSGANATLTTNVAATGNLANVVVDTEVYNASGTIVLQNVVPASLVANQLFSNLWNVTLPAANGRYTVKVGIFPADYSALYFWIDRAFQFNIGTPLGPPQPGVTYPLTVLQPANSSTVSGLTEIQAVINGLDINTYTISWRTGTGTFFPLDTDPITQAFKHAWIGFSTWNWLPPGSAYPIEFQATDQKGNVIGDTLIHVIP